MRARPADLAATATTTDAATIGMVPDRGMALAGTVSALAVAVLAAPARAAMVAAVAAGEGGGCSTVANFASSC